MISQESQELARQAEWIYEHRLKAILEQVHAGATDRKFKRYFCPGVYGSAPLEPPPPGRRITSLYRCLRLQVGSLALAGSKSHGGCGTYYFACLLACLPLAEVCSLLMYICTV